MALLYGMRFAIYQKGLSNKQIADIILNQEDTSVIVVPDSAEPKSNDELVLYGVNVLPANKGQGSVNHGIQVVQSQKIFITKRSVNIWKEYTNYAWLEDKEGTTLNKPKPGYDHAMDAGRYAMETLNIDTGLSDIEKFMLAEARRNGGTNFSR
jgi:phage terminase large subunit